VVVDAGPLIAAAISDDRHHARCVELLSRVGPPLLVPSLVPTEVAYFLGNRLGPSAEQAFARALRDGELALEPVEPTDLVRIVELLDAYRDLPLGIVDASVIAACERLDVETLATLDRRHFSVVRPRHRAALTLVPE